MAQLTPYVRFNGNCREAMNFYKNVFGADLTLQTVGESPMAQEMPPEKQNLIMHSTIKKGSVEFSASDMMRDTATVGDNIGMMLNCENEEELNSLFKNLSEDGEVFMPIEKTFWGASFGVVTDKFGIEWSLNYPLEK